MRQHQWVFLVVDLSYSKWDISKHWKSSGRQEICSDWGFNNLNSASCPRAWASEVNDLLSFYRLKPLTKPFFPSISRLLHISYKRYLILFRKVWKSTNFRKNGNCKNFKCWFLYRRSIVDTLQDQFLSCKPDYFYFLAVKRNILDLKDVHIVWNHTKSTLSSSGRSYGSQAPQRVWNIGICANEPNISGR